MTTLFSKQTQIMSSSSQTQITTESGNRQNIFPIESQPELIENHSGFTKDAEKANGRLAMVGVIALIGAYLITGQIIPGLY